jgi:hypothetical protein
MFVCVVESDSLCYDNQQLPGKPHAPVVKGYVMGEKTAKPLGEVLYNANEVEPHVALELLERTIRLSLADRLSNSTDADDKPDSLYEKDKPDKKDDPPPPPEPMWNGPKRRDPLPWGGGGGGGIPDRPRLS